MSAGTATTTSFYRGEDPLRADKLNLALSERVARSGDNMDGFLTLIDDPESSLHAATKRYVDRMTAVGVPPGGPFLPLVGGTLNGDLFVGNNATAHRVFLNGPANDAGRQLIWDSAGVQRWSIGPDGTAEGVTTTAVTTAIVASGTPVFPVVTTAGVTSGMQVTVVGVTPSTYVSSAVGTASASTTTTASVAAGNSVIPIANTAGFLPGMTITNPGIPATALIKSVGGTTGIVTTTATSTIYPSFIGQVMTVSDITNVFPGMLAAGNGIAPDAFVTDTGIATDGKFTVSLSKDFTDTIISGQTVTFSAAVVLSLSTPTIATISSGSTVVANPTIVTSQNTTDTIASGTTLTLSANTGNSLHLNTAANNGGNWVIPITVNRSTGVVNFPEGLSINTPVTQAPNSLTTFQPILLTTSTWSGSPAPAGLFYRFHQFTITDNVDAGHLGTTGFHILHRYGGNQTSGTRVGQAIQLYQAQGFTTPGGSDSRYHNTRTGMEVTVHAGESAGGTAPTLDGGSGSVFALGSYSILYGPGDGGFVTGAQNYFELCGYNINISARAGTSVAVKHALTIDPTSDDQVQGSVEDACIQMAMQPGAIGWKNQIALGNRSGSWPLDPTSNIWGTYRSAAPRAMQANYGLNWRDIAFTTAPIAVPGFVVDGAGNLSSGALKITTTGNTTSIDTTRVHVTNTVLHSPSSSSGGWVPGMGLYDASGNQWLCTTTDGSAIDGIAGRLTGVSAVPIGPAFITGLPPSNPVAVTNQAGQQTANLDLTWSAAPALSIPAVAIAQITAPTTVVVVPPNNLTLTNNAAAVVTPPTNTFLELIGDGISPRITIDTFSGNAQLTFRKATGSAAAPGAVTAANPQIGTIGFAGHDGVAYSGNQANMLITLDGPSAWSATNHGTRFAWSTTPINSVTQAEVMRLTGAGNLLIGSTTDNATDKLQITGSARISSGLGVFGHVAPTVQPAFTGAKGSNAALASVIAVLVAAGFATDSTTA